MRAVYFMAREAGLKIPDTQLIELDDNKRFFAIKRFDRVANNKLHSHTLAIGAGYQNNPDIKEIYEIAENFNIHKKIVDMII